MTAAPWNMPIEAVRGLADLTGHVTLIRLATKLADLEPHAVVLLREAGFIAMVGYTDPSSAERHEVPVTLSVRPRENLL